MAELEDLNARIDHLQLQVDQLFTYGLENRLRELEQLVRELERRVQELDGR